ncbi:MAG: mutual gliding-motility protein MglA [Candidatus Sumerlaeota bacterium]|nr:mutual gliding-motility protein MglA [Candidatus Sumerlaeota bacterium]
MATLNYAFKEISCKIVYYGCGLCGKTTNLIHVHKTVPGKFRGELVSLATEQDRTLFFDFLPLDLGEVKGFKTKFQLYTVPGQVYYNATRKLVLRGVDGLVFVVDSQKDRLQENAESFENLRQNLEEYGYHLQLGKDDHEGIPWVLQLNKRDMPQISTQEEILKGLGLEGYGIPVVEAIAVNGGGVKETLKSISGQVIQKLNQGQGGASIPAPAKADSSAKPAAKPAAAPAADEYDAMDESELTDDALEKAPPAPAKAPAAKAAPAPAPAAAAPPPAPPAPPAPAPTAAGVSFSQASSALWRGMGTGSGNLSIANAAEEKQYQLTGQLSFLGFSTRTFSTRLILAGTDKAIYEGAETEFLVLESAPGQEGPSLLAWVRNDSMKQLFVRYMGFGGEINVLPAGKKVMPYS